MENQNLNSKVISATKWSALAEIIAKLVSPITSMILARLLTPEAFGVVATLTIVITFAELFTDAGFQKYLIQHSFKDEAERDESTNVAFWSNLILSCLIWAGIILFKEPIADLIGSLGLGNVLAIACVSIPLAAFSSIQSALYRRDLDFKTLFKVRFIGLLIPLVVTIPLAFVFRNYWALVLGTIASNLVNAFLLMVFSKWKPRLYYSWQRFKEMFAFTSWSLVEAIALWATGYVDIFIVAKVLDQYYLGLYTTSISLVGQIMGLITTATTPILFSSLSKLQDSPEEFKSLFLRFQKLVGLLVIPAGFGIYIFKDLVTTILLGNQWIEASGFVGMWGLTSALTIVFAHYCGEVYRALGKPKISVIVQLLHIVFLWPTVIIASNYGFETLYIARSLIRFQSILVNMIALYLLVKISPICMIKNVIFSLCAATVMSCVGYFLLQVDNSFLWGIISIVFCFLIYFITFVIFPVERKTLILLIKQIKK